MGTVGGRGGGRISAPVAGARPAEPVPSHVRCAKSSRNVVFERKTGPNWGRSKPAGNSGSGTGTGQRGLWMRAQKCHLTPFFCLFDGVYQIGTTESVFLERD